MRHTQALHGELAWDRERWQEGGARVDIISMNTKINKWGMHSRKVTSLEAHLELPVLTRIMSSFIKQH
jgi:hypothetical protein